MPVGNGEMAGVSTIMPVYGDAPFLSEAILSVLEQELSVPLELLVVLDRAEDETVQLLRRIYDARMRVIESSVPGLVAALNLGLSEAQHEFVARMDADDVMLEGRLAAQLDFLCQHPDVAAVGGQLTLIDEHGVLLGARRYPVTQFLISLQTLLRNPLAHPAVMFRKSAVIDAGAYREEFFGAEDYDLWMRLSRTWRLANLNRKVLAYRLHPAQVTTSHREKIFNATHAVHLQHIREMKRGDTLASTVARRTLVIAIVGIGYSVHRLRAMLRGIRR